MTLNINVLPARELADDLTCVWSEVQRTTPTCDSPYFRPEFTQAVAAVRDDVEVAVLEQQGQPVGFFPYQRGAWDIGRPVGGKLSDFQAVIAPSHLDWSAAQLMRGCRLSSWQFDHLLTAQSAFADYYHDVEESPYLDLTSGFESYCQQRRDAGTRLIPQVLRKARKMEREIGPLRFEYHNDDRAAFDKLLAWKSEQHELTDVVDTFQFDWIVELLDRIRQTRGHEFSGVMSTLYAGDELVAVHLGMQTPQVLHCWFPTFRRDLGKYSPGLILLLRLAEHAAAAGIQRIDLGKGPERYKYRFASGSTMVAHGAVDCKFAIRVARHGWRNMKQLIHSSPLARPARQPARLFYKLRQRYLFR